MAHKLTPWEDENEVMEKMLDEFEEKWGSLEETSWEEVHAIKTALWIGYKFKS